MPSRKPILILTLLTSSYSIVYILSIIITSIITGDFPNYHHTQTQGLGILFIFSVGIIAGSLYLNYFFPVIGETVHGKPISSSATPLEILLYISTPEEISVLDAIKSLSPKAYKFEIAKISRLSRMKVHRILLRLASRNIVRIERTGRYAQIYLKDWLT